MWYVIHTMKGREQKVADEVQREVIEEGETVFVFENEMEYRVRGQWIKDRKPFFPGYIFCTLSASLPSTMTGSIPIGTYVTFC